MQLKRRWLLAACSALLVALQLAWWCSSEPAGASLRPGDLPGYTGWTRPNASLARHFRLVALNASRARGGVGGGGGGARRRVTMRAGATFELHVACAAAACRGGGAVLAARVAGPALLMARVRDAGGGRYVVSARLDDPGEYAVEVVLEFARAPFLSLIHISEPTRPY